MNTKAASVASPVEPHPKTCGDFEDLFSWENEALDADRMTPPLFSAKDINDPAGLVAMLCGQSDPVSSFLWTRMSKTVPDALKMCDKTTDNADALRSMLVEFLNQVLTQGSIYDQGHFAKVQLRKETADLVKLHGSGETSPHLNRRLLEDAYPDHLLRPWRITPMGHTEEPWVAFAMRDRVGLALSGGGIRSATFNLGILQALKQNQVLERVSYLATVSGGGYIGGFWTRWWRAYRESQNNHPPAGCQKEFPPVAGSASLPDLNKTDESEGRIGQHVKREVEGASRSGPQDIREPSEFRHLREFSRFLIPRQGLNTELWSAASTILTGFVPSLLAAVAVVVLAMTVWTWLAAALVNPGVCLSIIKDYIGAFGLAGLSPEQHARWSGILLAVIVAIVLVAAEGFTHLSGRLAVISSMRRAFLMSYAVWSLLAILALFLSWIYGIAAGSDPGAAMCLDPRKCGSDIQYYVFNAPLFRPCMAILAAIAALAVFRLIWGRAISGNVQWGSLIAVSAALERVMAHLLAILAAWAILAGVWELARWLDVAARHLEHLNIRVIDPATGVGGVTAVLALLFYRARRWLTQPKKDQPDLKVLDRLKPFVPQILANGIVLLLFVLASVFILGKLSGGLWPDIKIVAGCGIILVFVLLLFDPVKFGQHEFYRSRLTRCYLGASQTMRSDKPNEKTGQSAPPDNRMPVERPDDDMFLCEDTGRPIHLICCAANHFWGDPLGTLHRGARSAVLSRFGIALGDHWMEDQRLRLSSAMTASAAAVNSLMGELNLQIGRAVPFVMTALNLRLGLWVKNPAYSHHDRLWKYAVFPGWFFMKEMLGWAQCRTDAYAEAYMHVSDGGHFENLALYELIRRHCRYIIVSDAGEDREFEFTDIGRAVRRVREDFGVEIEIDLMPLRRDEKRMSQQHIAVGTIHYNGVAGTDKGTIIYFKPTLTGDEPADVLQYGQRKPCFPHESTVDQFFDEAQFESYRRLGEHTANSSLRMLERQFGDHTPPADETLFRSIRLYWCHVPWMESDGGIRLCAHAADLEDALRDKAHAALRREFIGDILAATTFLPTGGRSATPVADTEQTANDALMAIRAFKLMEEAWVVCQLDRYSTNPRAQSWMSYLQRWAAMPTLRKWWPVLRPMFGSDFQTFASTELYLQPVVNSKADSSQVTFKLVQYFPDVCRKDFALRRFQQCYPAFDLNGRTVFGLELTWFSEGGSASLVLQVALAIVCIDQTKGTATWAIDDLFVPPELCGGGFHTKLLSKLIEYFNNKNGPYSAVHRLEVTLADVSPAASTHFRLTPARRQELIERIDFYRSRHFVFDGVEWTGEGQNNRMVLVLKRT